MKLTFRNISGKSFQIEIDPQSTVMTAKHLLSELCGINPDNIVFLYDSRLIPNSEVIYNILTSPNDFILFYSAIPDSELNSISGSISSIPQLCHVRGAPNLPASLFTMNNRITVQTSNNRSPDFFSDQDLQILTPYLEEPIISQVHAKPEIYSFIDPQLNHNFTNEFRNFKVPIETSHSRNFNELLKPTYPIVEVAEKIISCVDQEFNPQIATRPPNTSTNFNQNINTNTSTNFNHNINTNTNTNFNHNINTSTNTNTNTNFNHNVNTNTNLNHNTTANFHSNFAVKPASPTLSASQAGSTNANTSPGQNKSASPPIRPVLSAAASVGQSAGQAGAGGYFGAGVIGASYGIVPNMNANQVKIIYPSGIVGGSINMQNRMYYQPKNP